MPNTYTICTNTIKTIDMKLPVKKMVQKIIELYLQIIENRI